MCYIINNFHNKPLDKQELNLAYQSNPDGTGMVWLDKSNDRLHTCKFLKDTPFETIWSKVQEINTNPNFVNVGIHFRLGTGGGKTLRQTHPITVLPNKMYMMHNGVCSKFYWDRRILSDTQCMAFWLKHLLLTTGIDNIVSLKKHHKMLTYLKQIFAGNKVVLFDANGSLVINAELGEWNNGIWRSRPKGSNPYITK